MEERVEVGSRGVERGNPDGERGGKQFGYGCKKEKGETKGKIKDVWGKNMYGWRGGYGGLGSDGAWKERTGQIEDWGTGIARQRGRINVHMMMHTQATCWGSRSKDTDN